jgi:hypothetical protein
VDKENPAYSEGATDASERLLYAYFLPDPVPRLPLGAGHPSQLRTKNNTLARRV